MGDAEVIVRALRTAGIAPKVKLPAGVLAAIGVLLIVLGFILGEDRLVDIGFAVLASSGVTLGAGAVASPGDVIVSPEDVRSAPPV